MNFFQKNKTFIELHFIVFIWGFSGVLGALISISAIGLVWWRVLLATIIFLLLALYKKINLKISRRKIIIMLITGVIIATHWLLFFQAIKESNVSITLAAFSSASFFMSFLEPIFYKRKIIVYEVLFGVIVMAVLFLLFKLDPKYYLGIIYAVLAALLSGVFSLLNGKLIKETNVLQMAVYEFLAASTFLFLFLVFTQNLNEELIQFKKWDLLWIIILCVVCTIYPFISVNKLMRKISPYTVVLSVNMEPIYAIILAFFFLNEGQLLNKYFYLGAAIIFITVLLNGVLKNKLNAAVKKKEVTDW